MRTLGFREFAHLGIFPAFERHDSTQYSMVERNDQSLIARKNPRGVESVIIGFGIKGAKHRWLIRSDANHPALPFGAYFRGVADISLNISEKAVVIALQGLMISRLPTEIPNELEGSYYGHGKTEPKLLNTEPRENIPDCGRTKDDHKEIKEAAPPLQRPPASCMVERVSQDIETDVLSVCCHFYFLGGGGDVVGWRGPGPASGIGLDGCLGPIDLIARSDIWIVSFCRVQKGMKVSGVAANDPRHRTISSRKAAQTTKSSALLQQAGEGL